MGKVLQASVSLAAGLAAAVLVSLVSDFPFWPSRLDDFALADLLAIALLGALWASGLGLLVLFALTLRGPLPPAVAAVVPAAVLLAEVLFRTVHPWKYYGRFPVWMLERDFLQYLPSALAAGLVFGIVARRLGPNNSSKLTPLRGAA